MPSDGLQAGRTTDIRYTATGDIHQTGTGPLLQAVAGSLFAAATATGGIAVLLLAFRRVNPAQTDRRGPARQVGAFLVQLPVRTPAARQWAMSGPGFARGRLPTRTTGTMQRQQPRGRGGVRPPS
ncbi:hypothetical protein [Streptomyces sp. GS7]|uniref:hypothetical protein n=1 Tax=Streptomyces sp. GS7 TaxID=2692234 RepID=UPI001317F135|nr:hypothetical protein [Streptomyces sp. GS7]QHC24042.1 hypothetical protein GR130_24375 [Streptomyces sp. GS7]